MLPLIKSYLPEFLNPVINLFICPEKAEIVEAAIDEGKIVALDFGFSNNFGKSIPAFSYFTTEEINNISCTNYGLYTNEIANRLNKIGSNDHTNQLINYSKKIVNEIVSKQSKFSNNRIFLVNIDAFCDFICREQLDYLKESASEKHFENFFSKFFTFLRQTEKVLNDPNTKFSVNYMGFLFSRITSELVSSLSFFKHHHVKATTGSRAAKNCESILLAVLRHMAALENGILKAGKIVGKAKSRNENGSEIIRVTGFPLESPHFKLFKDTATKIKQCYEAFNALALSYSNDINKNHLVTLCITNRFLALSSMLSTIGNFRISFGSALADPFVPVNFTQNFKDSFIHILLSVADFRKCLINNDAIPAANSKPESDFFQDAIEFFTSIPNKIEVAAKGNTEILNDPKFEPYKQEMEGSALKLIGDKFYCVVIPEMLKLAILAKYDANYLKRFFTFLNGSSYEVPSLPFYDLVSHFYTENLAFHSNISAFTSLKSIIQKFLDCELIRIKNRLQSFQENQFMKLYTSENYRKNIAKLKSFIEAPLISEVNESQFFDNDTNCAKVCFACAFAITLGLAFKVYCNGGFDQYLKPTAVLNEK